MIQIYIELNAANIFKHKQTHSHRILNTKTHKHTKYNTSKAANSNASVKSAKVRGENKFSFVF